MSDAALRLLPQLSSNPNGPRVLYDAWTGHDILDADLQGLIPDVWLYNPADQPEHVIGAAQWISMFERAGFISRPPQHRPNTALRLFRGATESRSRGMSWTTTPEKADEFRRRHARHGSTAVFAATVLPQAMLAFLLRPGEGQEVVVNPQMLPRELDKVSLSD